MMLISANIGEWSEFYAFLKILADRRLVSADADLNPVGGQDIPVVSVSRDETGNHKKTYDLPEGSLSDLILTEPGQNPVVLNSAQISSKLATIFEKIAQGSLSNDEGEQLVAYLHCSHLRGMPAGSKEDISLVIHDPRTGQKPSMTYSIKSQVGSPSTLLNASGATNFIYELTPIDGQFKIEEVKMLATARQRIAAAVTLKKEILFAGLANNVFKQNLELVDYVFPELLSVLLLRHFSTTLARLPEILDSFGDEIELPKSGVKMRKEAAVYKVKHFLAAVALGMTPARHWDGNLSANGGYLIVKSNGDLVCYHIYNLDSFKDYLFKSTKFERGSESRHDYGQLYLQGNKVLINLNLQIRFTR